MKNGGKMNIRKHQYFLHQVFKLLEILKEVGMITME